MRVAGTPIREVHVFGAADPRITYNKEYSEFDACVGSGLDLWRWWSSGPEGYSIKFKAKVIAWHQLNNLVKLHAEIARERAHKAAMDKNK